MAENILDVRLQLAHKTEQEWIEANPILFNGEAAYSSDINNRYKIGDGVHHWVDLPYADGNNIGAVNMIPNSDTFEDNDNFFFSSIFQVNDDDFELSTGDNLNLKLGGY